MTDSIIKGDYKLVPISELVADEDNARLDLTDIEDLAADIKMNGLIHPLSVVNVGVGDKRYVVKAGNRRLAALKLLKVKEVPVIVKHEANESDIIQLAENLGRVNLHPLDLAQRLFDLADKKGAYSGKYTIKQLAERLRKSTPHVENLIRVRKKLCDDVWTAARASKFETPINVLFAWAAMDEPGQKRAFKAWEAKQDHIAAFGRKRRSGGEDEGEGGSTKKRGEGASELKKNQQKFYGPIKDVVAWKLEQAKGVTEKARYEGALELLAFMFGEAKRLSLVSAADMKAYAKAAAEAEAEVEEEEAEVEE
jgi:ParB/RepB/Spo0J family partition protein